MSIVRKAAAAGLPLLLLFLSACGPGAPATPIVLSSRTTIVISTPTSHIVPPGQTEPPPEVELPSTNPAGQLSMAPTADLSVSLNNSPVDASSALKCTPPEPAVDQAVSFCANKDAALGGASFYVSGDWVWHNIAQATCDADTSGSTLKLVCSGPQDTSVQVTSCGSCGGGDPPGASIFGDYTCAKGFEKRPNGSCIQASAEGNYGLCPPGSHWDNGAQYCLDNATDARNTDICPPGTVTYLPDYHSCLTKPYTAIYNCQTWKVPLGSCAPKIKKLQAIATAQPTACPPGVRCR